MKIKNVGEFFSTLSPVIQEGATKIIVNVEGKDFILKDRGGEESNISRMEIAYAIMEGKNVDIAVSF